MFFKKNLFNINMDTVQVFDLVVREFNDYEEIIGIIQKDDVVKEQIKDLDEESRLLFLMNYAKNFRTRFILGCGIILDGIPRLLPMVLNDKGDWIKKIV